MSGKRRKATLQLGPYQPPYAGRLPDGTLVKPPKGGTQGRRPSSTEADRPDQRPNRGGVRLQMKAVDGLTDPDFLDAPLLFQVPPLDEFAPAGSSDHNEYDGLDHNRYSRFSSSGLQTVSFSSVLLDFEAPYEITDPPPIHDVIAELHAIRKSGTAFRLRAWNPRLWSDDEWNDLATLRSVSSTERAGEIDARYLTLEFSEFNESTVQRQARAAAGTKSRSIEIKKGVTLHKLAVKYLKSGAAWRRIAKENHITGLRPNDDLYAWAKKHHRTRIHIPKPDPPKHHKKKHKKDRDDD